MYTASASRRWYIYSIGDVAHTQLPILAAAAAAPPAPPPADEGRLRRWARRLARAAIPAAAALSGWLAGVAGRP